MTVLVIDTHVLVCWLEANPKLLLPVRILLDDPGTDLAVGGSGHEAITEHQPWRRERPRKRQNAG